LVIAAAYALSLPRAYQAEVHLLPPLESDPQGMATTNVFNQLKGNLKSRASLRSFFEAEKNN